MRGAVTASELRKAERAVGVAKERLAAARDARDQLVAEALIDGWRQRDIADATGLTFQRIAQIAAERLRRQYVPAD